MEREEEACSPSHLADGGEHDDEGEKGREGGGHELPLRHFTQHGEVQRSDLSRTVTERKKGISYLTTDDRISRLMRQLVPQLSRLCNYDRRMVCEPQASPANLVPTPCNLQPCSLVVIVSTVNANVQKEYCSTTVHLQVPPKLTCQGVGLGVGKVLPLRWSSAAQEGGQDC